MINKEILKSLIQEQHTIQPPDPYIQRRLPFDMTQLTQSRSVVVITGIRRSGKSTWLQQVRASQTERDYYLNFDDDRLVGFELADFQVMFELFVELYEEQHTFYFDEIQNIDGWERFVRRLHDQGDKVYITGSNATMFSQELGTHLTGRYVRYEIFPFSYVEYLAFKNYEEGRSDHFIAKANQNRYYREYSFVGGFPEYIKYGQLEYLQGLYESILYRDIIVRHKLTSDRIIKALMHYLVSNVGKLMSYNALKNMLGVASANTISDYCSYLQDSYLCFFMNCFSDSLKQQSYAPKKIYCIDTGLAKAVGFRRGEDNGLLLENIVFLALKREGYVLYYHKGKYECDFVVQKSNHMVYVIQVCFDMSAPETREREMRGLEEALAAHPSAKGCIVTMDEDAELGDIRVISAARFLRETSSQLSE